MKKRNSVILDIFDFELSKEEMEQIAGLDRGEKHEWY